jgi:GT2 family glycosyltransferase
LVVRRALLEDVGGLHAGFDGAQDYDLVLRLTERTDRIGHVAAPVYSWRMSPQSTAADIHAKPEAHAASRRAVEEAIARRGLDAAVDTGFDPTWHRVRRQIRHRPLVTVVIPTRDRLDLLAPCVDLLRNTVDHEHLELLVVDNESVEPATLHYLEHFDGRVVRYPHRFNYARQMNLAAQEASGEVLLLLNNDARPTSQAWFDALLEHALRPEVGAVGARLRFPSGKPQHEGVVLNAAGVALNLDSGPWAVLGENIRDTAAVTAACMMIRTSVWHAVGGMDERLRVAYNDVDLCLRIGERGWRILYTPFAELEHAESSSRGSLHPEIDEAFYQRRWGPPRSTADPFFTTAVELLEPFSPRL